MAASLRGLRNLLCPNCRWHAVLPSSNSGLNIWLRSNSNAASITRTKRSYYPRTYPTLLVYPDGSTITIRYKEPRRIIRMPVDLSKLSDAERARVLSNRKPKQKIELVEDFDDNLDLNEYSKYFKKT